MISETDPQRHAITGVPQAMASISTRPNGSGQSIGNRSALAFPRKADAQRFRDNVAHRSGTRAPEIRRLPPTSPLSRRPEPYGQEMWDRRQNYPLRRCPQAGTDRAPFILAHPSRSLYGRPCWFLVRKSRSPQASTASLHAP